MTVSLSEALEVRGSPLTEMEIWALLCLGAEALQDIFITGENFYYTMFEHSSRLGTFFPPKVTGKIYVLGIH